MEHPTVSKIRQHGYPEKEEIYGVDEFNNEVYVGDEILVLGSEFFLAYELNKEEITKLESKGARYCFAK